MIPENIKHMPAGEAITALSAYLAKNPNDDEALTMRGMRHWALGNRADAINDYLAAIRINPASNAVEALRHANDILNFYNKDLLNP